MRKHFKQVLKAFFYRKLFLARVDLGITQEEMASLLHMATRSYVDLEHGENSCSAATVLLFLMYVCKDPVKFLEELRHAFESVIARV